MTLFKVTIFAENPQQGMVSYYVEKETPKAAFEHGTNQANNIFGENPILRQVRVEQDRPA